MRHSKLTGKGDWRVHSLPLWLLGVVLLIGSVGLGRAATDSLVVNGDLEQVASDGQGPLGWLWWGRGEGNRAEWTVEPAHGGTHALSLSAATPTAHLAWQSRPFPCAAQRLRVAVWLRTEEVKGGPEPWQRAWVAVEFLDADGAPLLRPDQPHAYYPVAALDGTADWTECVTHLAVPPLALTARITFRLNYSTGRAWLDDVEVVDLASVSPAIGSAGRTVPALPAFSPTEAAGPPPLASPVAAGEHLTRPPEAPPRPPELAIRDFPWVEEFQRTDETYPPTATSVQRKGADLVRDGRPVFLLGIAARGLTHPWLYRLLGVDYVALTEQDAPFVQVSREDGVVEVSFREWPWLETQVREMLAAGLLPWVRLGEEGTLADTERYGDRSLLPPIADFRLPIADGQSPDSGKSQIANRKSQIGYGVCSLLRQFFPQTLVEFGEGLAYSPWNAEGQRLRRNYWRAKASALRAYPVFAYELFHGPRLADTSAPNRTAFRQAMQQKYATIEQANRVWGTSFAAFDDIALPEEGRALARPYGPRPEGYPWALRLDWLQFMELRVAEAFQVLTEEWAAVAGGTGAAVTIPTPGGLNGDGGPSGGVHPLYKASCEDLYGTQTPFPGGDDVLETFRALFLRDLARANSGDKPIVDEVAWPWSFTPPAPPSQGGEAVTPGQMAALLWSEVVHGASAVTLGDESAEPSWGLFDPRCVQPAALAQLAHTQSLMADLAEVVLPRPRLRGKVGLFYSYETFRAFRARDREHWLRDPLTRDLVQWYRALLGQRIPTDVLHSDDLLAGRAGGYALVIVSCAARVPEGVGAALRDYVQNGGVLLVDHDSLRINDDTHEPLPPPDWLGVTWGETRQEPARVQEYDTATVPRASDGTTGVTLTATTAEVRAHYADGSPALTVQAVGNGRVYVCGAEFAEEARGRVLADLLWAHRIRPDVEVIPDEAGTLRHVEAHQLGDHGRYVWCAINWGTAGRGALAAHDLPSQRYRVREVTTGEVIPAPTRARLWEFDQLRRGVPVEFRSPEPVLLLLEQADKTPLTLHRLSDARQSWLERLTQPTRPAPVRVLYDAGHGSALTLAHLPTLRALLEKYGFSLESSVGPLGSNVTVYHGAFREVPLTSYQVLLIPAPSGTGYTPEERSLVEQFVARGGGLLVSGSFDRGWGGSKGQAQGTAPTGLNQLASALTEPFGLGFHDDAVIDPAHPFFREPRFPAFQPHAPHPLTAGVTIFQSTGMASLSVTNPAATVVLAGAEGAASTADAPLSPQSWGARGAAAPLAVLAALEHGRGRVAVIGENNWWRPETLAQADNAQLLLNLVRWLAGQEPMAVAREEIETSIRLDWE